MSVFKPGDIITHTHNLRAAGLSVAELRGFDRRLDAAAAQNPITLESVLRAKRRAKIFTSLANDLKDSSMHLQVAIELHRRRRMQRARV